VDSKPEKAVIKDLQRHPAKPFILHADFMRVNEKEEIQVRVPLHFLNEERCIGVRLESGKLLKTLSEVEVACLPKDLPEYIEVDMLNVHAGTTIHISDLVLPEGVRSTDLEHGEDSDLSIATVKVKRGGSDADGAGADGAADGAEGEESSED
jgi:large subunit ribosomal protein L25